MMKTAIAMALVFCVSTSALGQSQVKKAEAKSVVLMQIAARDPNCGAMLTRLGDTAVKEYEESFPVDLENAKRGLVAYTRQALFGAAIENTPENVLKFVCRLVKRKFNNFYWAELIQFPGVEAKKRRTN